MCGVGWSGDGWERGGGGGLSMSASQEGHISVGGFAAQKALQVVKHVK